MRGEEKGYVSVASLPTYLVEQEQMLEIFSGCIGTMRGKKTKASPQPRPDQPHGVVLHSRCTCNQLNAFLPPRVHHTTLH